MAFSARSPLLFPGDLERCPTRVVGRTPRYSITLWWLVRVRPAPPRSRLQPEKSSGLSSTRIGPEWPSYLSITSSVRPQESPLSRASQTHLTPTVDAISL